MPLIACGSIHEGHEWLSRKTRDIYVFGCSIMCGNFADSRMKVPRYQSSPTAVFSSSEVLAKITSIRSKLPTAACWCREKKRGNCEANLIYVGSDFGTTGKSFTVFFVR